MSGIGSAPFPITSKNPEVQKWFDQGNVLLHSFWFEEAERSFRWCLKLDPDCAMAYWGLARCGFTWFDRSAKNFDDKTYGRYKTFLKEAVKRKDSVSERERMYIEAWEFGFAPNVEHREQVIVQKLEAVALKYPDDIEAKAMLALFNIGQGSALANQQLIDQVLAKNPLHPGAHHASIHNWDGVYNAAALKSCQTYGLAAPNVGHAQHMPGHVFSKLGMWNEAAIAMDSATRTELRYMNDRLALPFETWNYSHNRDYLCYIQEQLGMAEASIQGGRDLIAAPRDPDYNQEGFGTAAEGIVDLTRALIKFERWDEILRPGSIPWPKPDPRIGLIRDYAEAIALAHTKQIQKAKEKVAILDQEAKKPQNADPGFKLLVEAADGEVAWASGDYAKAHEILSRAAEEEQKLRDSESYVNDPPFQPWPIYRLLGDLEMSQSHPYLAIDAYQKALKNEPNDAFTLSGLAKAYNSLGEKTKATYYADRVNYVWANADPALPWKTSVASLGSGKTVAETIAQERVYKPSMLDDIGPSNWQPFAAPKLDALDSGGKHVRLEDYRGKNVLLVFYLGSSCVHCVKQLETINRRFKELESENTVVVAVCSAAPDAKTINDTHIQLLSDTNHENARRFSSYDDFEDIELHSTILIDRAGNVRWKRTGGDPFSNIDFLMGEISRVNAELSARR